MIAHSYPCCRYFECRKTGNASPTRETEGYIQEGFRKSNFQKKVFKQNV